MQCEYVCFCQGSGNGGLLCRITDPSGTGPVSICYAMWGCFDSSGSSCIYQILSALQLMYSCTGAGGGQLPSHPLQLGECFTSWLEKLSSNLDDPREKAVIIIDNADLILVWSSDDHS